MGQKNDSIKILIVEDEIILAKDIEMTLAQNNFFDVKIATNYQKALLAIEETTPDLILCDINLQGSKDGIALIEEINREKTIPFIFITAYSDSGTITRIQKVGPDAYITKPFTEKQLISAIHGAIIKLQQNNEDVPTEREITVLKHLAKGSGTKEIAEDLCISFNTVETHRKNLLKKYDCKNTVELIYFVSSKKWI